MPLQKSLNEVLTKGDKRDKLWTAFAEKHPDWQDTFIEPPVDVVTFIEDPYYLNAEGECWDSVKEDLDELFKGYEGFDMIGKYQEAVFDEGIGGGKSYKTSDIIAYMAYRVGIYKNPQKFIGLANRSMITFMNMSVTADQAHEVLYTEIKNRIECSPWFNQFHFLPDPSIRSELIFPKNIRIIPGNSKETRPLGYNIFGAVMDEAAHYTETPGRDVAEEMFNALFNRIKNRFGRRGMLVMISSPRYVDDFIERKMEEAKTKTSIFSRRRAVWEGKPNPWSGKNPSFTFYCGEMFEDNGLKIPIEYKEIYLRNKERFMRDYMAIPSLALEPYFKQWALVEGAIDILQYYPLTEDNRIKLDFKPKTRKLYYLHIDLSLTTDATGVAMCHAEENDNIIIDLAMKIKAQPDREIDLGEIKGIIFGLKKMGFDIGKVTYDQFQSASSIQELNKHGFNAERLSVDKDLAAYETLKEGFYSGKIKMYRYEPLLMELRRLELVNGKKVDHPENGSKDVADAVAGAVYNCVTNQSNFQFWFGGDILKHKTQKEILKEAETLADGGLVPYGYYRGRRR